MRGLAALGLVGMLVAGIARAAGPEDAAEADEKAPMRRGLVADEPAWKWSGETLGAGTWVAGLRVVALGVADGFDVGVESTNLLLGHYNLRARVAVVEGPRPAVALDGGLGLVTALAVARLFIPGWRARPTLLVADLGLPITVPLAPGRFVTVRPWVGAAAGEVAPDDRGLSTLLGRAALTGGGAEATAEVHLERRLAVAGWQSLAVDTFGGGLRLSSQTGAALVLATGPVRLNLGLGALVIADLRGEGGTQTLPVPAIDVWARF